MSALFESDIKSLPLIARGKVRDIYAVGDDRLLIVTTDRLSAFDVVMPTPIPGKGEVLTQLANFWFAKLQHIVPNHSTGTSPESLVQSGEQVECRLREKPTNAQTAHMSGGAIERIPGRFRKHQS